MRAEATNKTIYFGSIATLLGNPIRVLLMKKGAYRGIFCSVKSLRVSSQVRARNETRSTVRYAVIIIITRWLLGLGLKDVLSVTPITTFELPVVSRSNGDAYCVDSYYLAWLANNFENLF